MGAMKAPSDEPTRSVRAALRGVPLVVATALLLVAVPARAATFGPDLNTATANYGHSCSELLGFEGCTVRDPGEEDMELVLPEPVTNGNQSGVITAIHVLSAAEAPAQFVIVEWSGNGIEKPFPSGVMAVSEQVTLHPGINNFNTNLPVDWRLAPNGFESWSQLSLSILNGTSPIPAQEGGAFATMGFMLDNGRPLTEAVEDLTVAPNNVSEGGLWPGTLLMSGEVTITTAQGGGGTNNTNKATNNTTNATNTTNTTNNKVPGPIPPPPAPQLVIPAIGKFKANKTKLPIRCVGPVNCAGTFRLQSLAAPGATAARKAKQRKVVTYASGSFSILAGRTQSVVVKLSKAGKRALKGRRLLEAYFNVTLSGGQGKSSKITLKR
jgi:hypothetical protein